jgi:hypothetical protein
VGTGGGPLGTERSSAISPHAGDLFAREVERASERARGSPSEERRRGELDGERREARRAGFGRARADAESEPRAEEATFRPAHAPVAARPAVSAADDSAAAPGLEEPAPHATSVTSTANANATVAPAATDPAGGSPASAHAAASPAAALPNALRGAHELAALPVASASEAQPTELGQMLRTGATRSARSAASATAPGMPDPAVLERAAEILRQIRLHESGDVRRLTLDLEPAELGRLSVQLALRAGKVTAIVRAESAATLEALAQREDELRAVFAERGLTADAVRFEHGFGGRSRGFERARAAAETPADTSAQTPAELAPAPLPHTPPSAILPLGRNARLDTYA